VAVHAERVTGGANGIVGFSASLPRGTTLLVGVWICLIAVVLVQAYFFAGRREEAARLIREAPLVAATLGIDVQRWRFAGSCWAERRRTGGRRRGGSERRRLARRDRISIMLLCLTSVVLGGRVIRWVPSWEPRSRSACPNCFAT